MKAVNLFLLCLFIYLFYYICNHLSNIIFVVLFVNRLSVVVAYYKRDVILIAL